MTSIPWRIEFWLRASIFDLRPDTEYEIRLKLGDPDGGAAEKVVRARTRPVPRAALRPRIVRATPETLALLAASGTPWTRRLVKIGQAVPRSALTPRAAEVRWPRQPHRKYATIAL